MKVLLDENLDVKLRHDIVGHDVFSVTFMHWNGLRNGKLVAAAIAEAFDVLVTNDLAMADQINLHGKPFAVVVLHAASNRIEDAQRLIPSLLKILSYVKPGSFEHVRS